MMLTRMRVEIPDLGYGLDRSFDAWVDLDNRWNGWLQPYMTLEESLKLAKWTHELFQTYEEKTGRDCEDDLLTFVGPHFRRDNPANDWTDEIHPVEIQGMTLYPMGMGWTWEEADENLP